MQKFDTQSIESKTKEICNGIIEFLEKNGNDAVKAAAKRTPLKVNDNDPAIIVLAVDLINLLNHIAKLAKLATEKQSITAICKEGGNAYAIYLELLKLNHDINANLPFISEFLGCLPAELKKALTELFDIYRDSKELLQLDFGGQIAVLLHQITKITNNVDPGVLCTQPGKYLTEWTEKVEKEEKLKIDLEEESKKEIQNLSGDIETAFKQIKDICAILTKDNLSLAIHLPQLIYHLYELHKAIEAGETSENKLAENIKTELSNFIKAILEKCTPIYEQFVTACYYLPARLQLDQDFLAKSQAMQEAFKRWDELQEKYNIAANCKEIYNGCKEKAKTQEKKEEKQEQKEQNKKPLNWETEAANGLAEASSKLLQLYFEELNATFNPIIIKQVLIFIKSLGKNKIIPINPDDSQLIKNLKAIGILLENAAALFQLWKENNGMTAVPGELSHVYQIYTAYNQIDLADIEKQFGSELTNKIKQIQEIIAHAKNGETSLKDKKTAYEHIVGEHNNQQAKPISVLGSNIKPEDNKEEVKHNQENKKNESSLLKLADFFNVLAGKITNEDSPSKKILEQLSETLKNIANRDANLGYLQDIVDLVRLLRELNKELPNAKQELNSDLNNFITEFNTNISKVIQQADVTECKWVLKTGLLSEPLVTLAETINKLANQKVQETPSACLEARIKNIGNQQTEVSKKLGALNQQIEDQKKIIENAGWLEHLKSHFSQDPAKKRLQGLNSQKKQLELVKNALDIKIIGLNWQKTSKELEEKQKKDQENIIEKYKLFISKLKNTYQKDPHQLMAVLFFLQAQISSASITGLLNDPNKDKVDLLWKSIQHANPQQIQAALQRAKHTNTTTAADFYTHLENILTNNPDADLLCMLLLKYFKLDALIPKNEQISFLPKQDAKYIIEQLQLITIKNRHIYQAAIQLEKLAEKYPRQKNALKSIANYLRGSIKDDGTYDFTEFFKAAFNLLLKTRSLRLQAEIKDICKQIAEKYSPKSQTNNLSTEIWNMQKGALQEKIKSTQIKKLNLDDKNDPTACIEACTTAAKNNQNSHYLPELDTMVAMAAKCQQQQNFLDKPPVKDRNLQNNKKFIEKTNAYLITRTKQILEESNTELRGYKTSLFTRLKHWFTDAFYPRNMPRNPHSGKAREESVEKIQGAITDFSTPNRQFIENLIKLLNQLNTEISNIPYDHSEFKKIALHTRAQIIHLIQSRGQIWWQSLKPQQQVDLYESINQHFNYNLASRISGSLTSEQLDAIKFSIKAKAEAEFSLQDLLNRINTAYGPKDTDPGKDPLEKLQNHYLALMHELFVWLQLIQLRIDNPNKHPVNTLPASVDYPALYTHLYQTLFGLIQQHLLNQNPSCCLHFSKLQIQQIAQYIQSAYSPHNPIYQLFPKQYMQNNKPTEPDQMILDIEQHAQSFQSTCFEQKLQSFEQTFIHTLEAAHLTNLVMSTGKFSLNSGIASKVAGSIVTEIPLPGAKISGELLAEIFSQLHDTQQHHAAENMQNRTGTFLDFERIIIMVAHTLCQQYRDQILFLKEDSIEEFAKFMADLIIEALQADYSPPETISLEQFMLDATRRGDPHHILRLNTHLKTTQSTAGFWQTKLTFWKKPKNPEYNYWTAESLAQTGTVLECDGKRYYFIRPNSHDMSCLTKYSFSTIHVTPEQLEAERKRLKHFGMVEATKADNEYKLSENSIANENQKQALQQAIQNYETAHPQNGSHCEKPEKQFGAPFAM